MKKTTMAKKTIEELVEIIEELDAFRLESEKERRFLGYLKRLRELKNKDSTVQKNTGREEKKRPQIQTRKRKNKIGR
jgi:hypothetical protein